MRVAIRRQAGSRARAWTARIVLAGTLVSGAAVTAGVTAAQRGRVRPTAAARSASRWATTA